MKIKLDRLVSAYRKLETAAEQLARVHDENKLGRITQASHGRALDNIEGLVIEALEQVNRTKRDLPRG